MSDNEPGILLCPHCGRRNVASNRYCDRCGGELERGAAASAEDFPELPRLSHHPYWGTVRNLGGFVLLLLLGWLVTVFLGWPDAAHLAGLSFAAFSIFLLFCLTLGVFWLQVWLNVRAGAEFLSSDRPLVRWRYTVAEWERARRALLSDTIVDPREAIGCAIPFLSCVGLGVGGVVGLATDFQTGVLFGAIGAGIGAGLAAIVPAIAAHFSNRAHVELLAADRRPYVALGRGELYYNGHYFRANGYSDTITAIAAEEGDTNWLRIAVRAPRASIHQTFDGSIVIPPRLWLAVKQAVPAIAAWDTDEPQDAV